MKRVVPGFKVVWVTHLQFIVIRFKYWYILQKKKKKFLTCPNPLKNLNLEQPTLNVEIQRKKGFSWIYKCSSIWSKNRIKSEMRKTVEYNIGLSPQRGTGCGGQCFHGNNDACRADINFIGIEVIFHSCRNSTTKFYAIRFPMIKIYSEMKMQHTTSNLYH